MKRTQTSKTQSRKVVADGSPAAGAPDALAGVSSRPGPVLGTGGRESEPALTCAFGIPWLAHFVPPGCLWCETDTAEAVQTFTAAVARGEYDAAGYTPTERKILPFRSQASVEGPPLPPVEQELPL